MTLRIPDDEVSRPQLVEVARPEPSPPVPAAAPPVPAPEPAVVLMPMRIITINSPEPAAPERTLERPVALAERSEPSERPEPPRPSPAALSTTPSLPAVDDAIPIDADVPVAADSAPESLELESADSDRMTPVAPYAQLFLEPETDPPAARAGGSAEPEPMEEEVHFDDETLTPAMPAVALRSASPPLEEVPGELERRSEPVPELSFDDVLAVESSPPAPPASSSPPQRAPSHPAPAGQGLKRPTGPPPVKSPLVIVPPHVGTVVPAGTEASGLRRKNRLWWEDLFNDDYLRACEKLTDEQIAREVDFVEDRLGVERGGALLDLACGTGRHAIEFARRGYEVVGFDLSLPMLARAGDEAQERDAKLNFVQGDMREMSFEEQFDGVYCWNTSFGYFEEDKNAAVIDRIHKALRAGGLFLLDVANRDFVIHQSPSLAWFEGDGCVCMDEMNVDFITSRMRVKRTMMLDDGRSREIEYSMRVYSLHELGKLLHEHGFKVTQVSGRIATPGVFFGNESPRTIILAEKR
jgi:SAM-dependent methyltransferase